MSRLGEEAVVLMEARPPTEPVAGAKEEVRAASISWIESRVSPASARVWPASAMTLNVPLDTDVGVGKGSPFSDVNTIFRKNRTTPRPREVPCIT